MKQLLILLCLIWSMLSCTSSKKQPVVHKTTDHPGYCYQDNGMWYIYYLNSNGSGYYYYGSYPSSTFTAFDAESTESWTPSSESVSNFSDVPDAATESMSEGTGESTGGSEGESGDSGGMDESSGESSGGSDSGGDGGGGDGGGGGD